MAYLVVYGTKVFYFQISQMIVSTVLTAAISLQSEAFTFKLDKRLDLFNEVIILLVTYNFLAFNTLDVEINFNVGYVPIATLCVYMLVCLTVILVGVFAQVRLKLRKHYMKQKLRKQRKALKNVLESTHDQRVMRYLQ